MNIKLLLIVGTLTMSLLSAVAHSSVSSMKTNGSARGYSLLEDHYFPTLNDPAFGTNELGSDDYSPNLNLDGASGRPLALDISNATGAPSIHLGNTIGSNSNISNAIDSANRSGGNQYGRWVHEHTISFVYDGNNNRWHHPDYPISLAGRPWSNFKNRSCIKGLKGTSRQNIVGNRIYFQLYHCK